MSDELESRIRAAIEKTEKWLAEPNYVTDDPYPMAQGCRGDTVSWQEIWDEIKSNLLSNLSKKTND